MQELKLTKKDSNIPFLYSRPQIVNVTENQDTIELDFKIGSYNDEPLFLLDLKFEEGLEKYLRFEDYKKEDRNLKCKIPKKNLDIILLFL